MLPSRVRLTHEQDLLVRPVAGHQHEESALLLDAGEVQQVVVLAELVVDVERIDLGLGAPDDREGGGAETLHEPGPAGRQIVLERTRRRRRHAHQDAHDGHHHSTGALAHSVSPP